jgi:hypothetical protein
MAAAEHSACCADEKHVVAQHGAHLAAESCCVNSGVLQFMRMF